MRSTILITFILFCSGVSLGQSSFVNTFSSVSYNSSTNQVTGYAYTEPSYLNYLYYNTHVNGSLLNFSGGLLDYESASGGSSIAEIWTSATGNGCDYYQMSSSHFQTMVYWVQDYWWSGQYLTGYWDEYNYYSFNGDSEDGLGGPYQGNFTYFGPGPSYTEYSDHIIFGGTEAWSQGDCTNRPSVTITPIKAVGKDHTALVRLEVRNPSNENITLTLNPISSTGSAKFTGTGGTNSNTRTITSHGDLDVEITGVTESSTNNNMRLKANYGANVHLDDEDFTVISVGLSLRFGNGDGISVDNEKRQNHINATGRSQLGGPFFVSGTGNKIWGHAIEIVGTVLPANYSGEIILQREVIESKTYQGMTLISTQGCVPPVNTPCNDTSFSDFLDATVSSQAQGGHIFDLDNPGFDLVGASTVGTIRRKRTNFRQWATVSQKDAGITQAVRVSADITWFQRLSVKYVGTPQTQLSTDVSNDNEIGSGSTLLTWDLTQ